MHSHVVRVLYIKVLHTLIEVLHTCCTPMWLGYVALIPYLITIKVDMYIFIIKAPNSLSHYFVYRVHVSRLNRL